jgi:hypothetical protein
MIKSKYRGNTILDQINKEAGSSGMRVGTMDNLNKSVSKVKIDCGFSKTVHMAYQDMKTA